MTKLKESPTTFVFLIDEFPQTILNIQEKHSEHTARQFLQIHRTLRSDFGPNMRFIYTGSIGLQQVVNRLGATNHMNDLTTVSLPPLTHSEAHALATALFKHHQTLLHPTAIDNLLQHLQYLVPYHLQLLVDRLTQKYKTTKQIIDNEVIGQVFNQLCEEQHTTLSLHYYDRLPRTFAKNDLLFAKALLNAMAQQETINTIEVQTLAQTFTPKPACNWVLATLIHDGYMIESKGYYYYLSPILRKWWQKYGMD